MPTIVQFIFITFLARTVLKNRVAFSDRTFYKQRYLPRCVPLV